MPVHHAERHLPIDQKTAAVDAWLGYVIGAHKHRKEGKNGGECSRSPGRPDSTVAPVTAPPDFVGSDGDLSPRREYETHGRSANAPEPYGRRRYWKVVFLLAALACGDPVSPETDFLGTYQLQTVNGQALPYVVAQAGQNTVAVTSDQIVVADGGSWSETANYRVTESGTTRTETSTDGGHWVRTGTSLALYSGTATTTTYTGTIGTNRLTFTDASLVQVFVK